MAADETPAGARVLCRFEAVTTIRPALAVIACPACSTGQAAAGRASLPAEGRGVTLGSLTALPHQQEAIAAIGTLVQRRAGWLTLVGGYGSGKTHLLWAAQHALAGAGLDSKYMTAGALLNELQAASLEGNVETRLGTLARLPVLAVDELDAVKITEFREEMLIELFGRRYAGASERITLIGCNVLGDPIPQRICSRARDKRFALCDLGDTDLRELADVLNPWGAQ